MGRLTQKLKSAGVAFDRQPGDDTPAAVTAKSKDPKTIELQKWCYTTFRRYHRIAESVVVQWEQLADEPGRPSPGLDPDYVEKITAIEAQLQAEWQSERPDQAVFDQLCRQWLHLTMEEIRRWGKALSGEVEP